MGHNEWHGMGKEEMVDRALLRLTRLLIAVGFIGACLLCQVALQLGYAESWIGRLR